MITGIWITYWLFLEAFQVAFYFWPVSLFLAVNSLAALAFSRLPDNAERSLALLSPLAWPILIISIGGFGWHNGDRMTASAVPTIGVTVVFGIQLILSVGLIYLLVGLRWIATAVSMVAAWFGLICWVLAGMALTNLWL